MSGPQYTPRKKSTAVVCTETGCTSKALVGGDCGAPTRSGVCGRVLCRAHRSRRGWCPSHERAHAVGNYRPLH